MTGVLARRLRPALHMFNAVTIISLAAKKIPSRDRTPSLWPPRLGRRPWKRRLRHAFHQCLHEDLMPPRGYAKSRYTGACTRVPRQPYPHPRPQSSSQRTSQRTSSLYLERLSNHRYTTSSPHVHNRTGSRNPIATAPFGLISQPYEASPPAGRCQGP